LAHAPEQLDLPVTSATHMYSARPEGPVRYMPADPFAAPTDTPPAEMPAAGVELAAGAADVRLGLELELLLPHAATINPTLTSALTLLALPTRTILSSHSVAIWDTD